MVRLFICGDIVNYEHQDGIICSDSLSEKISEADYSICNFEAPIESKGEPIPKVGVHHYQRKETINGLKQQGFDLLCMANNHIMDFGSIGLEDTLKEAQRKDLDFLGVGLNYNEAYQPLIKNIKGLRLGFINACEAQFGVLDYSSEENQAGYAWINHHKIDELVIELKEKCDFVIFLSHAGLEHYNIPQQEWRQRYKHLCDLGADVVVGSHPHVPQGYEKYNNSFIFYSLGNFYFDSKNYIDEEDRSYSIILDLEKSNAINFEMIFHHKNDGLVQLSTNEKKININTLNSYLGKDYKELHKEMSLNTYYSVTKRNLIYSLVPIPYDGNIISSIKMVLNIILRRNKKLDKKLLSLHYFRNEAYYYATRHALELIAKQNMDGGK